MRGSRTRLQALQNVLTYEVVVLAGLELQAVGLGREGAESDGDVGAVAGLVADRYDARVGGAYVARVVLLLGHLPDARYLIRALSCLRGLRGAPEVPPLCRETSVSRTANVGTVGMNGLT